ncbi:hypothetical protein PHMEG_00017213, partial [Phytophthora megakarya]
PGRKDSSKKKSWRNDNRSDEDPDSDDSRLDDNASSDSDSSTFGYIMPSVPVIATMQQGMTLFNFNPFINANSPDDFNKTTALSDRIRWLEKFQRSNLQTDTRRDWKKFLKTFRGNYCKARTTDSEKYYTIAQRKSETPREFYYRLKKTVTKAGIDIRSTPKLRDQHVKTFIRKLTVRQLRSTQQGLRIRSMTDVDDKSQKVAMVHVAVNNCRTNVLLDSGATVSMLSLDLARRLRLNLTHGKPLRVTELDCIPTIITARTDVKITLGPRVVYVIELRVVGGEYR